MPSLYVFLMHPIYTTLLYALSIQLVLLNSLIRVLRFSMGESVLFPLKPSLIRETFVFAF